MRIDKAFIQKAVVVNLLLIAYFSCSNLSSFFGIILGLGMFTTAGIFSFFSENQKIQQAQDKQNQWVMNPDFLQTKFNNFLQASLGKQLFVLLSLYIITKISWYLPTWFLLFVISETYVFWDLLKEYAVFDKIDDMVKLCRQSIEKVVNLIPKYEAEPNN